MKPEALLILVLGGGALIIVVINDWWKQRLVDKARAERRSVRRNLLANKTQWGMVVALVIGFGLYAFLLSNPVLADRDFGPLNPSVEWLLSKPN